MKVTSSFCAEYCIFAIEENKSGCCRHPKAKALMGQPWAPLRGFDCPFYTPLIVAIDNDEIIKRLAEWYRETLNNYPITWLEQAVNGALKARLEMILGERITSESKQNTAQENEKP